MYDFSVFVPFSGILLIYKIFAEAVATSHTFSSPSPGCYLSIIIMSEQVTVRVFGFSSPSPGYYLSICFSAIDVRIKSSVFVPFSGCYLSIMMLSAIGLKERESFRPLIRGVTYLLCFYNGAVQALDFSSPSRGCYLSIGIHN